MGLTRNLKGNEANGKSTEGELGPATMLWIAPSGVFTTVSMSKEVFLFSEGDWRPVRGLPGVKYLSIFFELVARWLETSSKESWTRDNDSDYNNFQNKGYQVLCWIDNLDASIQMLIPASILIVT